VSRNITTIITREVARKMAAKAAVARRIPDSPPCEAAEAVGCAQTRWQSHSQEGRPPKLQLVQEVKSISSYGQSFFV
jgi:hypothetical protein